MVRNMIVILLVVLLCGIATCAVAQSEQLVDPMRPLRGAPGTVNPVRKVDQPVKEALQLTAVLISEQRSVAVINGKSLQQGDKINGYKLIRICPNYVELRGKLGKRTLRRTGTGLKKISTKSNIKKGSKL